MFESKTNAKLPGDSMSQRSRKNSRRLVWGTLLLAVFTPIVLGSWSVLKLVVGSGWEEWGQIHEELKAQFSVEWDQEGIAIGNDNFAQTQWIQELYEVSPGDSPLDKSILYLGSPEFSSQVRIRQNHWTNLGPPVAEIAKSKLRAEDWTATLDKSYDQLILEWSSDWESVAHELSREAFNRPFSSLSHLTSRRLDWTPDWGNLDRFYRGMLLRNLACLRAGITQEPLENFRVLLRVFEAVDSISWTGHSFSNRALLSMRPVIWEGLAQKSWDIHSLKELQEMISLIRPMGRFKHTVSNELQKVIRAVENLTKSTQAQWLVSSEEGSGAWYSGALTSQLWNLTFYSSRHLQGLNLIHYANVLSPWYEVGSLLSVAEGSAEPEWKVLSRKQESHAAELSAWNSWIMQKFGTTKWTALTFQMSAETEIWMRLIETAVALERFKTLNGAYPVRIQALQELELIELSKDLSGENHFLYQRQGPGMYRLYSRGLNYKDEMGAGDDLVWEGYPSRNQEFASRVID